MRSSSQNAVPGRRWRIAWLLGLGVLVNYFDRVNLSVSYAALNTTFGISAVTFGYLSGAYNWTYAMCQLPIGVLLDKFGIRRVGLDQYVSMEYCFLRSSRYAEPRWIFCGAVFAGGRGSADISIQCKGDRPIGFRRGSGALPRRCSMGRRSSLLQSACRCWVFFCSRSDGGGASRLPECSAFYIFFFSGMSIAIPRMILN